MKGNISQLVLLGQHNFNTKQTKSLSWTLHEKEDNVQISLMNINAKITKHNNKPKPNLAIYKKRNFPILRSAD